MAILDLVTPLEIAVRAYTIATLVCISATLSYWYVISKVNPRQLRQWPRIPWIFPFAIFLTFIYASMAAWVGEEQSKVWTPWIMKFAKGDICDVAVWAFVCATTVWVELLARDLWEMPTTSKEKIGGVICIEDDHAKSSPMEFPFETVGFEPLHRCPGMWRAPNH